MRARPEQLKFDSAPFINLISEVTSQVSLKDIEEYVEEKGILALHSLFLIAYHQEGKDAEAAAYVISKLYSKSTIYFKDFRDCSLFLQCDIEPLLELLILVPESDYLQRYFSRGSYAFREIFEKFQIEMEESAFLKYTKERA
jgi:hypothetical protein